MTLETYPVAGGHEGAGVIEEIGPNTPGWKVGYRVVLSFLPPCGRCRWCASSMQNLCDSGARTLMGTREDGTYRMTFEGEGVVQLSGLGTLN
jgi:Zn-dependent alcohol dehydrogenase